MECSKNIESKYEKISCLDEEGKSVFELHFKKFAENYHNYLISYFISEGGALTDEFRFIHARGKS